MMGQRVSRAARKKGLPERETRLRKRPEPSEKQKELGSGSPLRGRDAEAFSFRGSVKYGLYLPGENRSAFRVDFKLVFRAVVIDISLVDCPAVIAL